jgi:hypothetical protein
VLGPKKFYIWSLTDCTYSTAACLITPQYSTRKQTKIQKLQTRKKYFLYSWHWGVFSQFLIAQNRSAIIPESFSNTLLIGILITSSYIELPTLTSGIIGWKIILHSSYKVYSAHQRSYNQCWAGITFFSMKAAPVFFHYFFQRIWIFFKFSKFSYPSRLSFFFSLLHNLFLLFSYWSINNIMTYLS